MAAVTATPTTLNDRPSRVTVTNAHSSALAKAASTTTPPSLTQLP